MKRALVAIGLIVFARTAGAQFATIGTGPDVRTTGQVLIGSNNATPQAQLHLIDIYTSGGKNLLVGDDTFLTDVDQNNTLGIFGNQNSTVAGILLGSNGPLLSGANGSLGIGTPAPVERLQLGDRFTFHDGGTKVLGFNFRWVNNDVRIVNAGVGTIRFGSNGDLQFRTAPPGPANSVINYPSQGVIIDNQGRLGIGGQPGAQVDIPDIYNAGGKNLLVGNDAFFTDIDDGNVLGLYGNWNNSLAGLKLGGNGPVLFGANQNVGIDTRAPIARLHVNKSDGIIGEFIGGNGAILWTQGSNPTPQLDQALAADTDDDAIYVAGTPSWRFEKRWKSNGALINGFGNGGVVTDQSVPGAFITSVAVKVDTLYIAGHDDSGGIDDSQWITEARNKHTGALLWRQITNPSTNVINSIYNDTARAVAVDDAYVYVAGRKYGQVSGSTVYLWRIEKRDRFTGALVPSFGGGGIAEFSNATNSGEPFAMKSDGSDLYIVGHQAGWRILKVNSTTGALVWLQNSVPTNSHSNAATAVVVGTDELFIAGYEIQGVNSFQWRIEKRAKGNGALVNGFGSAGVVSYALPGLDRPTGIALDATGLYVCGFQGASSSNKAWKVEKRDAFNGALLGNFGTSGTLIHDPSPGVDNANGIVVDASGAYVYGLDSVANAGWRVIKLQSVQLQGFNVVAGGNVGIGTRTPVSRLEVAGGDIRVTNGNFIDGSVTLNVPDYVFDDGYELMPMDELAAFVRTNKHLPNVPDATDVKETGLNLSQMQMRLLEKVEELTLYALAQHERLGTLRAQNEELQNRIAALEGRKH